MRANAIAAEYRVKPEDLKRSYPGRTPLHHRVITERKYDDVSAVHWIFKVHLGGAGDPVPVKRHSIGETTHTTNNMNDIRS